MAVPGCEHGAMTATTFEIETIGKVAHLRLNRPDAYNSMTREFWSELPAAVRELDAAGSTRALVISSTGKHFCAGMDLGVFTGGAGGGDGTGSKEVGRVRAQLRETVLALQGSFTALEEARFPVIAAIQGGCIGGAVDMISACDLRYASADAFFCVQEINLGMTADVGTLQRLPKIIPDGIAREWAYRGHRVPAARAAEVGLVNEVFDTQDAMLEGVLAIAAEIAGKSPLAIWGTKEMATYTRDHSVADSLKHMAAWQSGMFQPADMMETFVAKGEGRDPQFDDLLPHGTGL
jgi:enoyl-CoA hydratase